MTKKLPEHEKNNRKPIGRACTFCHKKHLQCDPGRPCKNCVKRGVADSCQDVERKRAKYLTEAKKLQRVRRAKAEAGQASPVVGTESQSSATSTSLAALTPAAVRTTQPDVSGQLMFPELCVPFHHALGHSPLNPASDLSESPSMAKPIRHSIQDRNKNENETHMQSKDSSQGLNDSRSETRAEGHTHTQQLGVGKQSILPQRNPSQDNQNYHQQHQTPQSQQEHHHHSQQHRNTSTVDSPDVFSSLFANQEYAQLADLLDNNSAKSPSQSSVIYNTEFQTSFQTDNNTRPYISLSDNSTNTNNMLPNIMLASDGPDYTSPLILRHLIKSPEEVYTSNLQPYNYPKAYHALLDYLRKRFNKNQLIQIAETMAAYRPSFIAATRSLVEMDLLFAERSFQRSLLEYESMSSLSSSPTIMWRRTGEVVAVSTEFSSLTSHTKTELLSKRTFIIELMNDSSALDYFRLFSSVAFGDLNGVIITECTLMSPNGEQIRCASTWTVKRDVFDIPMLIVGQFLPILQVK